MKTRILGVWDRIKGCVSYFMQAASVIMDFLLDV